MVDTGRRIRIIAAQREEIVFRLNDSPAANAFYQQLPLSVSVEDYAGSEKIFYPPENLGTNDTPMAQGPAGTLAYYAPWGNVAIFYGECGGASGLYELGEVVCGLAWRNPNRSGLRALLFISAGKGRKRLDAPGAFSRGGAWGRRYNRPLFCELRP